MEDETSRSEAPLAPYTQRFMADARPASEQHRFLDGVRSEALPQAQLADAMAGFDALPCRASAVPALEADGMYLDAIDATGQRLEPY